MTVTPAGLDSLRPFSETPELLIENGVEFILLPKLKVPANGELHVRDGLLCPNKIHDYITRLFLSEPIPSKGQNWRQFMFFARNWHTPSWQGVEATLPLPQMLLAHLGAYR